MFGTDRHLPCAWCVSKDTYFKEYRAWEEDERGNTIHFTDLSLDYSARDELWYCNRCENYFVVDLPDPDSEAEIQAEGRLIVDEDETEEDG